MQTIGTLPIQKQRLRRIFYQLYNLQLSALRIMCVLDAHYSHKAFSFILI